MDMLYCKNSHSILEMNFMKFLNVLLTLKKIFFNFYLKTQTERMLI